MENSTNVQVKTKGRDRFKTGLGVITATLGSAVGLGNIWKFPYLTGEFGGAAFIIVYLLCVLLVGLPIMVSELILGRSTKTNAIGAFRKLAPNQPWYLIGVFGVFAAFLILSFYSTVVGWVYAYVFKAIGGSLLTTDSQITESAFGAFTSGVYAPILWQFFALAVVTFIIIAGVSKGIEKVTKVLMPVLFVLLVIIGIRSLTLPGASEGLEFLFKPDFSKISGQAILIALGLAFFKLSIGMGTMMTYGSYFREDQNIPKTATTVALSDVLVSMLAGIAIFPAVFAFGFQPDAGPSLLFITIPTVFSSMPFGAVFMSMFFLLAAFAATMASLSMMEVPVAYLTEALKWSRKKAALTVMAGLMILGALSTLSFSSLASFTVFDMTFFGLFDYVTSNVLMPLGGLFIAIFIAWKLGKSQVFKEASNNGSINNHALLTAFLFIVKYVSPILITIILLQGLGIIKL